MRLRHRPHLTMLRLSTVALAIGATTACGSDGGGTPALPAPAEAGREVTRTYGCSACHGRNGEGGPGPSFVGLYGSTVELNDGESVVADHDYLFESIRDPGAKVVDGYGFPMPANDLSDDQIDSVITYIEALSDTTEEAG